MRIFLLEKIEICSKSNNFENLAVSRRFGGLCRFGLGLSGGQLGPISIEKEKEWVRN